MNIIEIKGASERAPVRIKLRNQLRTTVLIALACISASCSETVAPDVGSVPALNKLQVQSITLGQSFTCAVAINRHGYCWGANNAGQLGNGSVMNTAVLGAIAGTDEFQSIDAGTRSACGITVTQSVKCWGQLVNSAIPTAMTLPNQTVRISAGGTSACALDATGIANCWGNNTDGQLGTLDRTSRANPTPVSGGLRFTAITMGTTHACALTSAGIAYCWGDNSRGQLGDGSRERRPTPTRVNHTIAFASISASNDFTCALAANGDAFCWGKHDEGVLGSDAHAESLAPVKVIGGLTFAYLRTGPSNTCGVTRTDVAWCWGDNSRGQIGGNVAGECNQGGQQLPCAPTPARMTVFFTVADVQQGDDHSCVIYTDQKVYCWGRNDFGQLGDGTLQSRTVPVR